MRRVAVPSESEMKRWFPSMGLPATLLLAARAQALDVTTLRDAGPVERRYNVVVMGDGYRVEDQAQLASDAEAFISYLFGVSPLQSYAPFFNVKLVHVISNENGGDGGDFGAVRDTALGALFDCGGVGGSFGSGSLICLNDGAALSVAIEHVAELDLLLVLVNDTKVGGAGGSILVSSAAPASFEIVAHELGHRLGNLADESESAAPAYPSCSPTLDCFEANATIRTERQQIKWSSWIEADTPVPTPETGAYAGTVGLFEGARYESAGVYRPAQNCKMRELGQPYCAVCSEQLVRSIWSGSEIRMIESFSPEADMAIADCAGVEFQVTSPVIVPSTYRHTWTVDGVEQADGDSSFELDPTTLAAGEHEVRVLVEDDTALVRSDPDGLLDAEQVWTISITHDDCAGSGGSNDAGVAPDAGSETGSGGAPNAGAGGGPSAGASGGTAGAGQGVGDGGAAAAGDDGGLSGTPSGVVGGAPGASGSGTAAAPRSQSAGCGCVVAENRRGRVSALLGLGLALGWLRRLARRR